MSKEMMDKVVIITGALGALGKVLVKKFAQEGAIVYACFRGNYSRFEQALSFFGEGKIFPSRFDITSSAEITTEINHIYSLYNRIDVLVNNAGVNKTDPFMLVEDDTWDTIINTNLTSVKRMCTAVAKPMILRKSGSIVNVSSVLARTLGRGSSAYAASKAALERFTEIAAVELGKKGIRVNAVAPGLLETGMGATMMPQAEIHSLERTPLGRKGTLDEVANVVLFLASNKASYITGHTLTVDGGLSCG
jgi:3-oxoacyl-[acyl-carrier protein] reductase